MSKQIQLNLVAQEAATCSNCVLYKHRIRPAFAKGNSEAKLFIIGEALGEQESLQGTPFCGPAGKMLDGMIAAMGMSLNDVYITNTILDRPPGNRKPFANEIVSCLPFLQRQLDIVQPKVILALGATASEALLGIGQNVTQRRGYWFQYKNMAVRVSYHPSYLLRNLAAKSLVQDDLRAVLLKLKEFSV